MEPGLPTGVGPGGPEAEPPTVSAIARGVRSGTVAAEDVLADHLERHRRTHAAINALVQPRHTEAAAEVRDVSAGVLAGVPVSVKECFAVAGLCTTVGLANRAGRVDDGDCPLVARLKRAGAVVVGKGNVPQAMALHETDNPVWGRTNHPADADRGPGGSSGGDAALVAAGVVPLAVGNDLAGSLRQPAHACGIAAIMPRTSALGDGGGFTTLPSLTAMTPRAGFLARRVADLRIALEACDVRARHDGERRPVRVGWWDATGPIPASPAVRRGIAEAVARLTASGVEVRRLDGRLADEAAWLHLALLSADGGADLRALLGRDRPIAGVRRLLAIARLPSMMRPLLAAAARLVGSRVEAEALLRTGPRRPAQITRLLEARDGLAARVADVWAGFDAVVCPVSALPALRHGTAGRLVLAAAPCLLANLLDLAAGAVPVTRVRPDEERGRGTCRDPVLREAARADEGSAGLPVGVQVVGGPQADEADVLAVMQAIEGPPQT